MRVTRAMRALGHPILPMLLVLPILSSCGTEEPPPATVPDGDLFPLTVGDFWLYDETKGGETSQTRYEVAEQIDYDFAYDDQGALPVSVINNTFPAGGGDTDSSGGYRLQYYHDDGTRVVRMRHDVYDETDTLTKVRDYVPGFLRFDRGKITVGEQWAEDLTSYTDSTPEDGDGVVTEGASYLYEVLEPESVTVPAGTFDCVVVQRMRTSGSSVEIKIYYFAPGVGKVKEITEGTKEEVLVEYEVASTADGGV